MFPIEFCVHFLPQKPEVCRIKRVNREVSKLAAEQFHERRPLFCFDEPQQCIFLHPDWIAYLKQHLTIIEGWTLWHWADYMQRRNPGIPAVTRKLFPARSERIS